MKGSRIYFPIQNESGHLHFIECGEGGRVEANVGSYRIVNPIIGYQVMQGTIIVPEDNILFIFYAPGSEISTSFNNQLRRDKV